MKTTACCIFLYLFLFLSQGICPKKYKKKKDKNRILGHVPPLFINYLICFIIHSYCPYSVASLVQCSLIGVISGSFSHFNVFQTA